MFDTTTLETIKTIPVEGRPDGILFEPATARVYVVAISAQCHGDQSRTAPSPLRAEASMQRRSKPPNDGPVCFTMLTLKTRIELPWSMPTPLK